jgi:hypothetical protein
MYNYYLTIIFNILIAIVAANTINTPVNTFNTPVNTLTTPDITLLYEWTNVEYDWPDEAMKFNYTNSGWYTPENNAIAGVKFYKGEVYVTVPRCKFSF